MRFDPAVHREKPRPRQVLTYSRSVHIDRPAEEVLAFCLQAHSFRSILPFRIEPARDTDELSGRVDHVYPFNLRFGPAWLRWEAHIVEQEEEYFVDRLLHGPMRWWLHEHHCVPEGEGCRYTDRVEYRSSRLLIVDRTVTAPMMDRLFRYRQRRMKELLDRHGGDGGV